MTAPVAQALADYRARLHPEVPPRRGRARWRRWLAFALAAVLVAGGAWVTLWGPGPRSPGPPAVAGAPGPLPDSTATDRLAAAGPGAASGDPSPPADALVVGPGASWRSWSAALTTWLPAAPGVGPADRDPARLAGFARTRDGALMAAGNVYPAIYYTRDQAHWDALADRRVVWPVGARETLTGSLNRVWSVRDRAAVLRPVGFRMLSYTPEQSRIRLWWRLERLGSEPVTVGSIVTVRWVEGDWWLVFDEPAMDLRALDPARDGYVPWGPGEAA